MGEDSKIPDVSPEAKRSLLDAIDRIVSGNARFTNGKVTQENIAEEAGLSRATLIRCEEAMDELRKVKNAGSKRSQKDSPITIQEKNKELQEMNTELRRKLTQKEKTSKNEIDKARQEIYVLQRMLAKQDERIQTLQRKVTKISKTSSGNLKVVK